MAGGRRIDSDLPGTVDIVHHLSPERFVAEWIYLEPGREPPVKLPAGAILNHIGDPDICSKALDLARQVAIKTGRPCFNHPDAVAGTTRDRVSRVLAGTPGLDVPKTFRTMALTPAELRAAVSQEELEYPVLVRVAGAHGGTNMVKIDMPGAADEMDRLDRSVRPSLYVTEFRDFAGSDGRYRKFRIAVVGEDIFVRHMVTADNWLIHARRRAANTKEEEFAMFAAFEEEYAGRLRPIFRDIGRRLDLARLFRSRLRHRGLRRGALVRGQCLHGDPGTDAEGIEHQGYSDRPHPRRGGGSPCCARDVAPFPASRNLAKVGA